jgi:WD40 repeat protein
MIGWPCHGGFAVLPDGHHILVTPGSLGVRSDRTGLSLIDMLNQQEQTQWKQHSGSIQALAISTDGKLAAFPVADNGPASIGNGVNIAIISLESGNTLHACKGHSKPVMGLAFSPDNARLASAAQDGVKLWEVISGKELASFEGHKNGAMSVAFSPNGRLLATGDWESEVRLWAVATEKELAVVKVPGPSYGITRNIIDMAFSPNNKFLATARGDGWLAMWDVQKIANTTDIEKVAPLPMSSGDKK